MVHPSLDLNQLVQCPFCQTLLQNHAKLAWQSVHCPACRNQFVLPGQDLPVAAPVDMDLVMQLLSRMVQRPLTQRQVEASVTTDAPRLPVKDPTCNRGPRTPASFPIHVLNVAPTQRWSIPLTRESPQPAVSPQVQRTSSQWRVIADGRSQADASFQNPDQSGLPSAVDLVEPLTKRGAEEPCVDATPVPSMTLLERFRANLAAWNTSLLVHVVLIVILGLITYAFDREKPLTLESGWLPEVSDRLEATAFDTSEFKMDVAAPAATVELPADQPTAPEPFAAPLNMAVAPVAMPAFATIPVPAAPPAGPSAAQPAAPQAGPLAGRSEDARQGALARFGGTPGSEKAVARGLAWLREHQFPDGSWQFSHDAAPACRGACRHEGDHHSGTAATALGLLPFLGAGHTHRQGKHQPVVERGLAYLLGEMTRAGETAGDLRGRDDRTMYSHGLAAIAICEAYAMTRDEKLKEPAQLALDFITYAQDPRGGGWRYEPRERGDTSVVGWQLMALKSGHLAGLQVPQQTIERAGRFLDSMSDDRGAYYGYQDDDRAAAPTAIGLLCRMYTGWDRQRPGLERGAAYLDKTGPSQDNMYYNYYATQVLMHWGGAEWKRWNGRMRDYLIEQQSDKGHESGSWYFDHDWSSRGGRLYDTSLAILILEVYYRHLPIYRDSAVQDTFQAAHK